MTSGADLMDPYLLEIPRQAEYLTTARLFAGAIARQYAGDSAVDDVKLAVTEAATALLGAGGDGESITFKVTRSGEGIRFAITCVDISSVTEAEKDPEGTLRGLDLARAVFPSLEVTQPSPTGQTQLTATISFELAIR
ncbi:MAG: ATP-binding protein [Acidimicrobiia bacterium]|nr:ATP-binding protein [Acidimicrobiia bacterium]NNC44240.1 hypothetical protein [Acidimicrobiia bacterium]NND13867.1 hypothetical protein [Acidimicrobiia bacterium]